MDTFGAFARGDAARRSGARMMVFDWDRAAQIIKERGVTEASAGLSGDWEYTGGRIMRDGMPIPKDETYVYLASLWAEPELEIDDEIIECWKYVEDTPGWDENTYWPQSALDLAFESNGAPRVSDERAKREDAKQLSPKGASAVGLQSEAPKP